MSELPSLLSTLIRFWRFAFRGNGHKVFLLFVLMTLAALLEMATLASIVPLVASLIDGSDMFSTKFNDYLPNFIADRENAQAVVLGAVVVIVCSSAFFRVLVTRLSSEFAARVGVMLQRRYFDIMINAEYEEIVNEPSSRKINLITTNIPYIVSTYILNALTLATSLISAIGIVAMLVWLSTGVIFIALLLTLVAVDYAAMVKELPITIQKKWATCKIAWVAYVT